MKIAMDAEKKTIGDVSVMLLKDETLGEYCWEVYYRMNDTPWLFAFGLPIQATTRAEAWTIAEANIENYQDMFETA